MDLNKKKTVALSYDSNQDNAPKVIAKGRGYIAEEILRIAKEYGLYIYEDSALAEILFLLELYQEIPEELYSVVACVFAKLYEIDKRASESFQPTAHPDTD
ncbi:MAG: EscU/YscU/HrcU family type III secretion system export apparatus switch protein [Candidatus Hydrogenedentota bacterium]